MTVGHSPDTRKVAGALGAEITGLRLAPDLPDDVVAYVRAAILEHKVVFLHGQDHLDDAAHAGFVRRLGPLTSAHPTIAGGLDEAAILPVDSSRGNKANAWHTDVTFVDRPPAFTTLRAQVLPPYGGDTVFANTARAYATLPASMRALVDDLWAEHCNDYDYATSHAVVAPTAATAEYQQEFTATIYRTHHPVVRVHPETGEPAFVLGQFVSRFLEVNGQDSRSLFDLLQRHITRLENTVRWRWSPGDIALWDNRATQHYAVDDYDDLPRRMHRVTVVGDVPVSLAGQHSVAVAGDASVYAGRAAVPAGA
ncbi:TauD/TfdA family dioxygenase [Actinomycetospora sp. TBRC 11914]|uniref:TauD/TfdA dioxygenase family protein n=1 Tax=Actinomycetospora sp. TBRC 11914 TaxID=2729387 RepID=UPI00145F263A|nr:TauD/TfdA family dioxygenase [Actinomycetospora sp. TBRC 11914]NMO88541.1 TauD/TfdA family dioxygenase [Actinomycetospora sp. TBRC 11914]